MIYGLKEKLIPMRIKREKEETKCIKEILKQLNDEDENTKFEKEVEEVIRLGPYIEGGVRPDVLNLFNLLYPLKFFQYWSCTSYPECSIKKGKKKCMVY